MGTINGNKYRRQGASVEREDEIGALWAKTSQKGTDFLSGKINGVDVVIFRNTHKQAGEKTPDWRVYKSQPRGE